MIAMLTEASRVLFIIIANFQESAQSFLKNAIPGAAKVIFENFAPEFGEKVVRIIISEHCDASTACQIRQDLQKVGSMLSELTYDLRDNGPKSQQLNEPEKITFQPNGDKLMEAIKLMQWIMEKTGRKYSQGLILSKDSRSTSCYTIPHTIRAYLNELCQVRQTFLFAMIRE